MTYELNQVHQLPIPPASLLRKHEAYQRLDTRFRSCARLLQSLWRERHGLPKGYQKHHSGKRRLGSMIGLKAAEGGRNFLLPAVADVVRHEVAYQEAGAFIDQRRLYANLLSSMPLAFNLFAPLRLDLALARRVLAEVLPNTSVQSVTHVLFEHSPGRRNVSFTADRTAFDVAIVYKREDGERGFLGIEVKYTETLTEHAPTQLQPRYGELAAESGLFSAPASKLLHARALQQLFREHLLAQAMLMRGGWAEAQFIVIAPRDNHHVQQGTALYAAHLLTPLSGHVPFINVHLERFITALGAAGEEEYAHALHDRYCDWAQIDAAVGKALRSLHRPWQPAAAHSPTHLLPLVSAA